MAPHFRMQGASESMDHFIRSLSPRAEFLLVLAVGFGWFVFVSVLSALQPSAPVSFTDDALYGLLKQEALLAAAVAFVLVPRGWRWSHFGAAFQRHDMLAAVLLAIATYLGVIIVYAIASSIDPTLGTDTEAKLKFGTLSFSSVALVSIINPIFEEVLVCGYVITVLKARRSFWFAVNVSVALRVTEHLYQGSGGVLSILPMALVSAIWFARTNRIWPVILMHAAFDFIACMPYVA